MKNLKSLLVQLLIAGTFLPAAVAVHAEVQTREVDYEVDGESFTGYLAYDDSIDENRPGVLIVHEWWGHGDYVRKRAEMLAELGYVAFALDMYGSDKYAEHPSQANEFMQAVLSDQDAAKARFTAALSVLREQPMVAQDDIAALGYCFGGAVVLNMARAGVDLDGVVSYHGMLATESPAQPGDVSAAIRVFNGEADPMVPSRQVADFKAEMTAAEADYELVNYAGAQHGFTNPEASDLGQEFELPLAYDANADADSWRKTQQFLEQLFR